MERLYIVNLRFPQRREEGMCTYKVGVARTEAWVCFGDLVGFKNKKMRRASAMIGVAHCDRPLHGIGTRPSAKAV